MSSWLFLVFFIHQVYSIPIGHISNVSLILASSSSSIITNTTKQKCLCAMAASSNISAFNYFSNNTCEFFSNVSLTNATFSWLVNTGSVFYFLQLPTRAAFSSPLIGTTVFGNADGDTGSSLSELRYPWSVTVNNDDSLLITDSGNLRVLRVAANAHTGVVVASGGIVLPCQRAYFDDSQLNLFVIDILLCRMRKYYNSSQTYTTIFGSSCGTDLNKFGLLATFYMDSMGNFYIADKSYHRIMFWAANNSTTGVLLAGTTSVSGNDATHLENPLDITVDEEKQLFYVADTSNHRIMRYSFGNPNGTVVAGGNGPGVAANQLNEPCGIYLSKNTSVLYIADSENNRIVRWRLGASEGTTIAGDNNGTAGGGTLCLNYPTTIAMDKAERYMYVSDLKNNRIQMFTLPI